MNLISQMYSDFPFFLYNIYSVLLLYSILLQIYFITVNNWLIYWLIDSVINQLVDFSPQKLQEPVIRSRRKVVYAKTSRERLPSDLRSITLDDVKRRMSKLSGFKKFLAENFASLDLQCLQDIEQYRRIPRPEVAKVVAKAMDIKWKYYNEKYLFGPNSPANKEGQNKVRGGIMTEGQSGMIIMLFYKVIVFNAMLFR